MSKSVSRSLVQVKQGVNKPEAKERRLKATEVIFAKTNTDNGESASESSPSSSKNNDNDKNEEPVIMKYKSQRHFQSLFSPFTKPFLGKLTGGFPYNCNGASTKEGKDLSSPEIKSVLWKYIWFPARSLQLPTIRPSVQSLDSNGSILPVWIQ